tara:strand:- start:123 stop:398 length:276 start_codon:yes stop_codon:yes gene_type:complete
MTYFLLKKNNIQHQEEQNQKSKFLKQRIPEFWNVKHHVVVPGETINMKTHLAHLLHVLLSEFLCGSIPVVGKIFKLSINSPTNSEKIPELR